MLRHIALLEHREPGSDELAPTYLLQTRGFSVAKMGIFASLPFIAGAVGYYVGGHISDRYFSQRRQIPIAFGSMLAAAMTYCAAIAPTGEWPLSCSRTYLIHSYGWHLHSAAAPRLQGGGRSGVWHREYRRAGRAFLSPLVVGYILNAMHSNFELVFYCLVGLFAAAMCAAVQIKPPVLLAARTSAS